MKVKELIEKLEKLDGDKEIKAKYYYKGTDNDRYRIGDIEDNDIVYIVIKWDNAE